MAGYGGPVLTPADFATLQNTLGPMGVLTQMEAERVAQAERLGQAANQAQQAAGQAGQAYQEAAAAPAPNVAPNEELLNTLTGGIASVLQGNQGAAQRANQRTRDTRGALLQARSENLQALRDGWKQKADYAEKAGDLEESIAARTKLDQLNKTLDVLGKQQDMASRSKERDLDFEREKELIKLRGRMEKEANAAREQAKVGGDAEDIQIAAESVENGQTRLTDYPYRTRIAIVKDISGRGGKILQPKVRDTINNLSAARGVLSRIGELSAVVNTAETGKGRVAQGLKSMAKAATQSSEADALFDETRQGLLATISRASGERGVLTDRDVARAKALLPDRFDTKAIAQKKIRQFEEFLNEMEQRTVRVYTTAGALSEPAVVGGNVPTRPTVAAESTSGPKAVRYGYDKNGKLIRLGGN